MKLRQKLAVVLASAMVLTAVPVVTMATSTTSVSKTITVANEDELAGNAPLVRIALKDKITTSAQFYLTLENAKWAKYTDDTTAADYDAAKAGKYKPVTATTDKGATITVEATSDTEATVKVGAADVEDILNISLATVKVTGEAKISVDGNDTEISNSSPITFATKSDSDATVTVKDDTKFYTTLSGGEKVGTILISEQVAGSLVKDKEEERTITIELEHSDFEFASATVELKGSKGFSDAANKVTLTGTLDKDNETLTLVLPKPVNVAGKGVWEVSGIKVKSIDKSPETGDLNVTVDGKGDTKVASTEVKVAAVAEYGTELTVAEKKTITSGKDAKVKITYKEVTADSVAKNEVDFTIDKGYFDADDLKKVLKIADSDLIYKDMKDKKEDELIGFTIKTGGADDKLEKYIDGKELKVITKLDTEGDITLSTEGRYVEEQSVVVAEAKPNFKVETESMTLKVGQTKQVGGKFVITEAEKGALDKNSVLTLNLPDVSGISFTELPKVTVDGAKAKVEWKDKTSKSAINVTLTKSSKETPATITVEGVEVTVDRTVPQGSYDLKLSVSDYKGELKAKDFFVVGTPNVEELAANGLPKGTATFAIGSADYTVNGKVATMDATAYIQDPGYTMVPVRYVASAFGVAPQDILFSNGTATIFAGSRTVQLTAGSDVAIVNGASIKLATKVVVKDGRTYAPVGEIARILGVSASWDSANKVATFENK